MVRTMRQPGVTAPADRSFPTSADDAAPLLESGADDHMVTPYHLEELLARVRARLRQVGSSTPDVLSVGDVHLDRSARQCTGGDHAIALTALEFDLVDELLRHPSQTLTRNQLQAQTQGPMLDPNSNVIDVYVGYFRRKLGADIIHTVGEGVGYRLGAVTRTPPPQGLLTTLRPDDRGHEVGCSTMLQSERLRPTGLDVHAVRRPVSASRSLAWYGPAGRPRRVREHHGTPGGELAADAAIDLLARHDVGADDVGLLRLPVLLPLMVSSTTSEGRSRCPVWAEVVGRAWGNWHLRPTNLVFMMAAGVIAGVGVSDRIVDPRRRCHGDQPRPAADHRERGRSRRARAGGSPLAPDAHWSAAC